MKERKINMRKLVYVVGSQETTSYEKARELQPTGKLQTKFKEIEEEIDPKRREKIKQYIAKRNVEKLLNMI